MRGWVCVGAMAGFEVQVWWEGGHIQIPSTYTAVALWGRLCWLTCGPFPSTFPACLQTIYFSLIHNTNGLEHAFLPFFRNKVALVNVTCNDCSCLVHFSFCQEGVM